MSSWALEKNHSSIVSSNVRKFLLSCDIWRTAVDEENLVNLSLLLLDINISYVVQKRAYLTWLYTSPDLPNSFTCRASRCNSDFRQNPLLVFQHRMGFQMFITIFRSQSTSEHYPPAFVHSFLPSIYFCFIHFPQSTTQNVTPHSTKPLKPRLQLTFFSRSSPVYQNRKFNCINNPTTYSCGNVYLLQTVIN